MSKERRVLRRAIELSWWSPRTGVPRYGVSRLDPEFHGAGFIVSLGPLGFIVIEVSE